jgi:hypothetical protein
MRSVGQRVENMQRRGRPMLILIECAQRLNKIKKGGERRIISEEILKKKGRERLWGCFKCKSPLHSHGTRIQSHNSLAVGCLLRGLACHSFIRFWLALASNEKKNEINELAIGDWKRETGRLLASGRWPRHLIRPTGANGHHGGK